MTDSDSIRVEPFEADPTQIVEAVSSGPGKPMPSRPETWKPVGPPFSLHRYEVSDMGRVRSLDRIVNGRSYRGRILSATPNNDGYMKLKLTRDDGAQIMHTVHRLVLAAFAGPCPPDMETLHGPGGKEDNRWPENIRWGTKAENAADKPLNGGGGPTVPCRFAPACGNLVMSEGRRCRACVQRAGEMAGEMLSEYGMNLEDVTVRLGYENSDWVYRLAREFGGYEGTKRQARMQRPTLRQRVKITLRGRKQGAWA